MANWVYGHLSIKGTLGAIRRFLLEELKRVDDDGKEIPGAIKNLSKGDGDIHFVMPEYEKNWIRNATRMDIIGTEIVANADSDATEIELGLNFEQANGIRYEDLVTLSGMYDLELRGRGGECMLDMVWDMWAKKGKVARYCVDSMSLTVGNPICDPIEDDGMGAGDEDRKSSEVQTT